MKEWEEPTLSKSKKSRSATPPEKAVATEKGPGMAPDSTIEEPAANAAQ